jgi:hypothetical protein
MVHILKVVDNHWYMNVMKNQQMLELNYQLHMVHHCKDLQVLLVALMVTMLMEEMMVLTLIEILVMIKEIVKMEMIGTFDSLMVQVHRVLVLKKICSKRQ